MLENEVFINRYEPYHYYVAPCQIPKSFKRALREIGGRTPSGGPMLRIQWGMDIRCQRGGKTVPRYVQSSKPRRTERLLANGLVDVTIEQRFFGTPMFIIEEWHSPESFVPPGSNIDPEKDWEDHRFQYFYTTPGEPRRSRARDAPSYIFEMRAAGIQPTNPELVAIHQAFELGMADKLPGIPTFDKVLLDQKVDTLGPFPRQGRYEYLCAIRPAGAHPTEQWLDVIRESYQRRNDRRFASVEAEVADMVAQNEAQREKVHERIQLGIEDNLRTHVHRMFTSTPNKGGSGSRVFLSSSKE